MLAGSGAFVAMLVAWNLATGTSSRYYHGGSVLYALLACVVIAGALQPGPLRAVLSYGPLAWIGRLSYGLYLFHWPVIVWLVPTRVHLHGLALNALRLAVTFAAATLSFYLIEAPIREHRAPGLPWRDTAGALRASLPRRRSVAARAALPAIAVTIAIVLASSTGATPAPSYLSGTRTPQFASAMPKGAASAATRRLPEHNRRHVRDAEELTSSGPLGDPLFCGAPRPNETTRSGRRGGEARGAETRRTAAGLRILLLGDSTACSLYPGMNAVGDAVDAIVAQAAVFGCGMASGEIASTRGEQVTPHTERCAAMVEAAQAPAVAQMRPDIVIWMSLWETVRCGRRWHDARLGNARR